MNKCPLFLCIAMISPNDKGHCQSVAIILPVTFQFSARVTFTLFFSYCQVVDCSQSLWDLCPPSSHYWTVSNSHAYGTPSRVPSACYLYLTTNIRIENNTDDINLNMPSCRGINLCIISALGSKVYPEFPHPDSSQFQYVRSPEPSSQDLDNASASSLQEHIIGHKPDDALGANPSVSVYIPSLPGKLVVSARCGTF